MIADSTASFRYQGNPSPEARSRVPPPVPGRIPASVVEQYNAAGGR
jgi:hypothetical protein